METIDRRTVFAAGLAAASLISNATEATEGSPEARLRPVGAGFAVPNHPGEVPTHTRQSRGICAPALRGSCSAPPRTA